MWGYVIAVLLVVVAGAYDLRQRRRRILAAQQQAADKIVQDKATDRIGQELSNYLGDSKIDFRWGLDHSRMMAKLKAFREVIERNGETMSFYLDNFTEDGVFMVADFMLCMDREIYIRWADDEELRLEGIDDLYDDNLEADKPRRMSYSPVRRYVFRVWEERKPGVFFEYVSAHSQREAQSTINRRFPEPKFGWSFYRESEFV
ncbi:hypothetical protein [Methylobacterium sp. 13MFTsu3.1M2]|uniref:hypothetical protein n=1 Tax=Methylobacterium sp. 13MFTsu3.1M2 TaxID=1502776 RepID=UPI0008E849A4|nr:hypothetical protein [Methylobacterium sp. 13MFTsu3.1M2]SFE09752.1 hypothetical protein SAMN02799627_02548 [Methylobacterium sp. 13MFTsu3.1M2]